MNLSTLLQWLLICQLCTIFHNPKEAFFALCSNTCTFISLCTHIHERIYTSFACRTKSKRKQRLSCIDFWQRENCLQLIHVFNCKCIRNIAEENALPMLCCSLLVSWRSDKAGASLIISLSNLPYSIIVLFVFLIFFVSYLSNDIKSSTSSTSPSTSSLPFSDKNECLSIIITT